MATSPPAPSPNQQKIDALQAKRIILVQKRDRLNEALADCDRKLQKLQAYELNG